MDKEIQQAIDKGLALKKEKETRAKVDANKKAKALLKAKKQTLAYIRKDIKEILKTLPEKITSAIAEGKNKLVVISKYDESYDYNLWQGLLNKLRKMGLEPSIDRYQVEICVRYDPDGYEYCMINEISIKIPK